MMRFRLLDRITELRIGQSITAVKRLRADEEYLRDHFPLFPVMPGVLMLEAMFQAAMYLVRRTDNFAHSMVVLKEARNVKYNDFVEPGETLTVNAEILKSDGTLVTLKTRGAVDGVEAVSARLILDRFNLADRHPERTASDPYMHHEFKRFFERLYQPQEAPVES
jgi:3-hydroxyacyl-[acyl-carrier-protein] dehydratase